VVLIFTAKIEYRSDALYYYNLAQDCIKVNEFYPAKQHLFEDYIVAPLYINAIRILLTLYNSTITISLFNLLIILIQLYILYKIIVKIFSENIARITILLYTVYLNTLGLMLQNYTELLFLLLISSSIYFFLLNKNIYYILSGILLGCAIAVRSAAWALLIAFIILQVIEIFRNKIFSFKHIYLYFGLMFFILCFGLWTNSHFGKFEFTSTTGPVNLLLGANDDATGGFNSAVFQKGKAGYIENPDSMTFIQKGDFYQDAALNWITQHPIKWIMLAPLKFLHTFGWDDISLSSLLGYSSTNFARVVRVISVEKNFDKALPDSSAIFKVVYFSILILSHLFYYIILIAIILGIYQLLRKKLYNDGTLLILLFSLFSILMIMVTVGTPRYKYPIIIMLLPFAAYYLQMKFGTGKENIEKI
jgi:hypothetical protein